MCTRMHMHTNTHPHTLKRWHHKWDVSVSLRGLTLISRQRNTLPVFYFYQDHLRIDQVLASLWHGRKNKINSDVLFIYFSFPISVTLWDVSISRSLRSPSNIDAKSPLASVKQSDSSTNCICLLLLSPVHVHSGLSRYSIMIFHIPLFPFFPSCGFSFSILPSPSISTSANLTPHLVRPIYCDRPACRASIKLQPVDSAESFLPLSLFLTSACLSLCLSGKQSFCLSINVLSSGFLFLSVYLSVWHVGSCLNARGLLSAKCWFLFFCQFTCLSKLLRLDMSTYLVVFCFSRMGLLKK